MLNVDLKTISKALSEKFLTDLTSSQTTAHGKNKHIGESGRIISDIILPEDFLTTMDTEKAFDSLNHNFLISALEKHGFGKNFVSWVKILLRNQELCVLNGGTTTKYFLLKAGTRVILFQLFYLF